MTQNGSGTLTLTNAANNYTNGTTVSAGALAVSSGGGNLGTGPLTLNGGTLQASGGFTYSGNIALGSGGGAVDVSDGNSVTLSGVISGGSLTKVDSGTLALSGSNSYTGNTTVSQGTLQACSASALGAGTGNLTVAAAPRWTSTAAASAWRGFTGPAPSTTFPAAAAARSPSA